MILLAGLALVGAGCRRVPAAPAADTPATGAGATAQDGLRARVELAGDPAVATVPVVVYVLDGGNGVSGATVEVTGDMTHAGMMPVQATAAEAGEGMYRADDFAFTMAGDWVLTADVTTPDGRTIRTEMAVTVPASR